MQFRISSALKNLIGKELITDEFVAVFELVKNSFDANAKHVKVVFENQYNPEDSKIFIIDDGEGMDYEDLKNKWLFVAYSAKREGVENDDDYRDKIKSKRLFAGAKGVGRFSCDRLGCYLNLISKKDVENSKIENLKVNWTDFEEDSNKNFIDIKVSYQVLDSINYDIKTGTVLEISGLRDVWDRDRIKKLKYSLEKLINPIQENDTDNFEIEIIAHDELLQDKSQKIDRDKVNGKIKNLVFETLGLKTTQVRAEIIENGGVIQTTLHDRGQLIYRIKEKNPYQISSVHVQLFQLNRAAKLNFHKMVGIHAVEYGSVFMYKNGFRIYPFGEEGVDILQIDRRKAQGYNRYLGTRDLIGRIQINGANSDFKETTSRDGGLIKNESYNQLVDFFYDKALKRLEKYVVDIIKFGDERVNKDTGEVRPELNPEDVKSEILDIISNLTKAKEIIDIEYDKDFLQIIDSKQEKSVNQIVKNFTRIAEVSNNPELIKQAKQAEKHVKELISNNKQLEKEVEIKEEEKKQTEQQLEQKKKQNLFLQSVQTLDKDRIIAYHHDIGVHALTIQNWLNRLSKDVSKGNVDVESVKRFVEAVTKANNKVLAISRFATKANFNFSGQEINADIVSFIEQYSENVFQDFFSDIKLHFNNNVKSDFILSFKPIELSVLIDNLINNSIKAHAKNFYINTRLISEGEIEFRFKDDGDGLSKNISNSDEIFEKGFTTTTGSGLGLFHVATIVKKELKGELKVNIEYKDGFELLMRLRK